MKQGQRGIGDRGMKEHTTIPFPLSEDPSHYIAALNDTGRLDCTHVFVKLIPSTLIRLVWMLFVASVLRLVGVKSAVFEARAGSLAVGCLKYQGRHFLVADQETATDEAPYDCLSIGELANLGGYATNNALEAYFTPARIDKKVYAIDVHVERFAMWFKIHFLGQIVSIETNAFNLDIITEDFLKRRLQKFPIKLSGARR
jgi:hypothetical protein